MVELIPYLLIVIGWAPDRPDETMALRHSLHASAAQCDAAGKAFVAEKASPATHYRHFCISAPTLPDYQGLIGPGQ